MHEGCLERTRIFGYKYRGASKSVPLRRIGRKNVNMDMAIGVLLVIAGGIVGGLFSLPVTRTPRWQWENIWGLGSLIALMLVPWPVALLTVPNLMDVFRSVPTGVLLTAVLFGLGWGVGGIFWGKTIAALGMALGMTLLLGGITICGSPIPLAIKEPGKLIEPGGLLLLAALAIMVLGAVVCSLAGQRKDCELNHGQGSNTVSNRSTPFAMGLIFCVVSSVLSAMVNFGLIFGEPITEAACRAGASDVTAPNAIWVLVFTSNYLVNAGYAFFLMFKNKTLGLISSQGSVSYWLWALFMGITWPIGTVLFGMGASKMGHYGPFTAFPMLMLIGILMGNLAGALTGEWQGTSTNTKAIMLGGVVILCSAFIIFGVSSMLLERY